MNQKTGLNQRFLRIAVVSLNKFPYFEVCSGWLVRQHAWPFSHLGGKTPEVVSRT
jgi:hypothetical protein